MHVRIIKVIACLLAFAAIALMGVLVFGYFSHDRLSATSADGAETSTNDATSKKQEQQIQTLTSLVPSLTTTIQAADVSTSVSIIDIDTGRQYDAGLDVDFRAASTTKVLTALAFIHQVEQGKATLNTQINGASAQVMLQRLLQYSDNTAWSAFNDFLGREWLESYAHTIGLSSFAVADNTITAHDEARLMAQLVNYQDISQGHAELLMSFMQNTDNEQLIPAALPTTARVYHKYGYLEGELHDAAIIAYKGHTFVVVIYTNNQRATIDDSATRTQLIHALTTDVIEAYDALD